MAIGIPPTGSFDPSEATIAEPLVEDPGPDEQPSNELVPAASRPKCRATQQAEQPVALIQHDCTLPLLALIPAQSEGRDPLFLHLGRFASTGRIVDIS